MSSLTFCKLIAGSSHGVIKAYVHGVRCRRRSQQYDAKLSNSRQMLLARICMLFFVLLNVSAFIIFGVLPCMMKAIVPVQRHIKPWEDVRFSCAICSSPKLAGGGWGETISSTIGGVATSVVGDQLSQRLTSWLGGGGNKEGENPTAGKPAESTPHVQFTTSRHHTVMLSGV